MNLYRKLYQKPLKTMQAHSKPCTCTGFWGCSRLTTPPPSSHNIRDKTETFIRVYREAKKRNILTCPRFKAHEIDRKIDRFGDKSLS